TKYVTSGRTALSRRLEAKSTRTLPDFSVGRVMKLTLSIADDLDIFPQGKHLDDHASVLDGVVPKVVGFRETALRPSCAVCRCASPVRSADLKGCTACDAQRRHTSGICTSLSRKSACGTWRSTKTRSSGSAGIECAAGRFRIGK